MLDSDWRVVSGFGGSYYQGIDKQAIESTFRALKIDYSEQNLAYIKAMQDEAKKQLNKKK